MEKLANTFEYIDGTEAVNVPYEDKEAIKKAYMRLAEYEKLDLLPEELKEIDKLYKEACEKIAKFESTQPLLQPGDHVWCIINLAAVTHGDLSAIYLKEPIEKEVLEVHIRKDKIVYQLLDRSFDNDSIESTVFTDKENAIKKLTKIRELLR